MIQMSKLSHLVSESSGPSHTHCISHVMLLECFIPADIDEINGQTTLLKVQACLTALCGLLVSAGTDNICSSKLTFTNFILSCINVQMPSLEEVVPSRRYYISITSSNGDKFLPRQSITFSGSALGHILVKTDKPIYKPAQTGVFVVYSILWNWTSNTKDKQCHYYMHTIFTKSAVAPKF